MEKSFDPIMLNGQVVCAINLEIGDLYRSPGHNNNSAAQVLKFQDAAAVASSSPSSLSEFNGCNMTC